jgi:hypothetical protein
MFQGQKQMFLCFKNKCLGAVELLFFRLFRKGNVNLRSRESREFRWASCRGTRSV